MFMHLSAADISELSPPQLYLRTLPPSIRAKHAGGFGDRYLHHSAANRPAATTQCPLVSWSTALQLHLAGTTTAIELWGELGNMSGFWATPDMEARCLIEPS